MQEPKNLTDAELIDRFQSQPEQAWPIFVERHVSRTHGLFRHWGLEHQEAGDCFATLCAYLAEEDFQRLRQARDLADRQNLFAWLRESTRRVALDWAGSDAGLRRIQAAMANLSKPQQRISALYFLEGRTPPEIRVRLRDEMQDDIFLVQVLEQLEEVFQGLTSDRLWRLLSLLARSRRSVPKESAGSDRTNQEPAPESSAQSQEFERLRQAWSALDSRTALILQLRYDDCQSVPQIALIVGLTEEQVQSSIRSALVRLGRSLPVQAGGEPSPGRD